MSSESNKQPKARVIAFYLPQFHPIPENDKWWGKGFTEWINVGKAKPLFKGHLQPRVPADLGYYDLRMPEIREAQAQMAREAGIEGFCYWHYWFSHDKQLLERPFNEVLQSGKPDFPFCLGWANHDWTNKTWDVGHKKVQEQTLMKVIYSEEEYIKHFYDVLPAFKDKRYITVDEKPLFFVYSALGFPDTKAFITLWQDLAKQNGLKGIFFVGLGYSTYDDEINAKSIIGNKLPDHAAENYRKLLDAGYDAVNSRGFKRADYLARSWAEKVWRSIAMRVFRYTPVSKIKQKNINKYLYVKEDHWENVYPTLLPNWDRTARSGRKARLYYESTPEVFEKQIQQALTLVENRPYEHRILILQSWNEWAEGNYVEPDLDYGHGYLEALKRQLLQ